MVGVVVNGQPYSAKVCYEKGLVHDPVSSGAWFSLGSIDNGRVNGQPCSAELLFGWLPRDLPTSLAVQKAGGHLPS